MNTKKWLERETFNSSSGEIIEREEEAFELRCCESRKLVGVKVPRGENAKLAVLDFVVDNEPTFEVLYTKYGNPKPECFDKADSLEVARAGYKICKQKN